MNNEQLEEYLSQYEQSYYEYLKTLKTSELKNRVESESNYTINSSDNRELLISDIIYDETLKLKYDIIDYNLTHKQIKNKIEYIKQQIK